MIKPSTKSLLWAARALTEEGKLARLEISQGIRLARQAGYRGLDLCRNADRFIRVIVEQRHDLVSE